MGREPSRQPGVNTDRLPAARPGTLVVGIAFLVAALLPASTWVEFLQHPIRVERLGEVPSTTISGVGLLRMAAAVAGVGWLAWPAVARRLLGDTTAAPGRDRGTTQRGTLAILAVIVAVGMVLRAARLGESLWYDEIAAVISSSLHGPGPALGNYHALANHAFHSALVAISLDLLGSQDAELAIRLPAFLAGVACIPAMFMLGRRVDGDRFGLVAAMLVALMPVAILESAEARGYSMMMLFAILATVSWLDLLEGRSRAVGPYAILVALGCWSHLVFACVPIGHAAHAAGRAARGDRDRRSIVVPVLGLAVGAVTTLAILAPLLPDLLQRRTEFIALDGDEPSPLGIEGLMSLLQMGGSWTWWAALPGLGLLLIGGTESLRWPSIRTVATAGLAGGVVAIVLAIGGGSWIYARFLVFLVVPATMLMATGLRAVGELGRRPSLAVATSVVVLAAWSASLALLPPKQPIREAVELARGLVDPATAAIWSIGLGDDVAMFYTEGRGPRTIHAPGLGRDLDSTMLRSGPDVAVILYPDLATKETRERMEDAGFRVEGRFEGWLDWGHGDVVVMRRTE